MSEHKLLSIKTVLTSDELISDEFSKKFLRKYDMEFETDGKRHKYEMVSRTNTEKMNPEDLGKKANAVCMVPIYEDGKFLVCREFRYPLNDYCWEFPAGLVDEGETVEQAAVRELKEEVGLDKAEVIKVMPAGFSSAGMTDERVAVAILKVEGTPKDSTGMEDITPYIMNFDEVVELINNPDNKCSCRMQCIIAGMALGR